MNTNELEKMKWEQYQIKSLQDPVKPYVVKFIKDRKQDGSLQNIKTAVDLGCGAGKESAFLASLGIKTTGYDQYHSNLVESKIRNSIGLYENSYLSFARQGFENLQLKNSDLVLASVSLPFCNKDNMAQTMQTIARSINPDGYFLGTFFAPGSSIQCNQYSQEQLESLFNAFGFKTQCETSVVGSQNNPELLNNLVTVTAQAPEQIQDLNENEINQILGIEKTNTAENYNGNYEDNTTPTPMETIKPETTQIVENAQNIQTQTSSEAPQEM